MNEADSIEECPLSKRVDGKLHSWHFDGDDPYIICYFCHERRDAISGKVIIKGLRTPTNE